VNNAFETYELHEDSKPYGIRVRCFHFSKQLIIFVQKCSYDRIYFSLFDQLIRGGTSIGANIVEARAGGSKKDWLKFYIIALKSANETKYWLCLLRDTIRRRLVN
jgi:four helix bundle protein